MTTIRDGINRAAPTDFHDWMRITAPALLSAMLANLPLAVRGWDIEEIVVAADTTGPLGNAETGSGVAGTILEVEATQGGAPGVKTITNGAPLPGEVNVTYDAVGIPTLLFNAADAITEARVKGNFTPSNFLALLDTEIGA